MEKEKVVGRIESETGEAILFFPERGLKTGYIAYYSPNGEHGEANHEYYKSRTYPAREEKEKRGVERLFTQYERMIRGTPGNERYTAVRKERIRRSSEEIER